jgi:NADH-quinone oxidoreductase subunit G
MPDQETNAKLHLNVCFGTSCFIRGAKELYTGLKDYVKNRGLADTTEFTVSFCNEQCTRGPVLTVNGSVIDRCTMEKAAEEIEKIL